MTNKPEKIKDYTKSIRKVNKHFFINATNIENGFNIYKDKDGKPFFNLLATRIFPDEMAPNSCYIHKTNGSETLQNISWKYYEMTKLWWIIAEVNGIYDPFEVLKPGLLIKVPNDTCIADILTELRK